MKVLMITAPGYDDLEVFYAYYRVLEAGHEVDIASVNKGMVVGNHSQIEANLSYDDVISNDYAGLILPGGSAPETVRLYDTAVKIAHDFMMANLPVAAICHGQQVLITAGVLEGRKCTSYASIRDDIKNAGAEYTDAPLVVDGNLVTSRCPQDLPFFVKAFLELI
jgi:protease I